MTKRSLTAHFRLDMQTEGSVKNLVIYNLFLLLTYYTFYLHTYLYLGTVLYSTDSDQVRRRRP